MNPYRKESILQNDDKPLYVFDSKKEVILFTSTGNVIRFIQKLPSSF